MPETTSPHYNPEINALPPRRVASLKGREDFLAGLPADEMRHGYRPGNVLAHCYHGGWNKEHYDLIQVERALRASS